MNYGQLNPQYLSMGSALNASAGTNPFARASGQPWDSHPRHGLPVDGEPNPCRRIRSSADGASAAERPIGMNNYNALQANFKHRFGQGLVFTASYTFSKFLSDVGGPEEWGSVNGDTGRLGYPQLL